MLVDAPRRGGTPDALRSGGAPSDSDPPRTHSLVGRLAAIVAVAALFIGVWFEHGWFGGKNGHPIRRLPLPAVTQVQAGIDLATPSTVKVEGAACGLATAGSGVIIADHVVLTAAHVVAGSTESRISDGKTTYRAVPIVVDPLADVALLYAETLEGKALKINTSHVDRGTASAVLGYPHGGSLDASPAIVLDQYRADQRDIYGQQRINRDVLEIEARVLPGSSGGPVVDERGRLIGMVFGQSQVQADVGFAVTAAAIARVSADGAALLQRGVTEVATGACLPGEA
jgi:S1-C subfamily serine protease